MGIKERKKREKENTRRLILEAAVRLFLNEGFEKVTMRRIAEEIEYSPATLYLYYKDKNEILHALYNEGFEELYTRQKTIVSIEDPIARLRRHAEIYISFALEFPELYDLMFMMKAPLKGVKAAEEEDVGIRSYGLLRQNIKDCMDAGYFKGSEEETVSLAMWSFVHGMASLIIRQRPGMMPEENMKAIINKAIDFIISTAQKR
jgi:AcrR family transcriptional regulator